MIPRRWKRWTRSLRFRGTPGDRAITLLYHSIASVATDPWSLAVSPAHFAEHLEVLAKYCHPVSLTALLQGLAGGPSPVRAVAVTFDDGYANNLYAAKPLLERFDVPATVFVVSGAVGSGREFWWDELDRMLTVAPTLPPTLPAPFRAPRGEGSVEGGEGRVRLYRDLWIDLHHQTSTNRDAALDALRRWAGVPAGTRPSHRPLDQAELTSLAVGGLIEIGAHTVSHPSLGAQSLADQRAEIAGSKKALQAVLDAGVTAFAYPHGRAEDFTADTMRLVREAGFASACANLPGAVGPGSDPYALPREYVRDWDGDEFARRLGRWFRTG